jgi:hypothetical protein
LIAARAAGATGNASFTLPIHPPASNGANPINDLLTVLENIIFHSPPSPDTDEQISRALRIFKAAQARAAQGIVASDAMDEEKNATPSPSSLSSSVVNNKRQKNSLFSSPSSFIPSSSLSQRREEGTTKNNNNKRRRRRRGGSGHSSPINASPPSSRPSSPTSSLVSLSIAPSPTNAAAASSANGANNNNNNNNSNNKNNRRSANGAVAPSDAIPSRSSSSPSSSSSSAPSSSTTAIKPALPRDYKTRNIKISVPQQWSAEKDDHAIEVIIRSTASPALTTEGRTLRASIARAAGKNNRSPGKQASIWFNFLTVPRWGMPQDAAFRSLFEASAAPVSVEAVVPVSSPTIIRRPKPVPSNQLTLGQMGFVEEKSSAPAPLYQQVNFSKASQESALSGELRLRIVFSSIAAADRAQRWITSAAAKVKNIGVAIEAQRDSLPLQCVEVVFDVASMHQDIAKGTPVADAVKAALIRRGITTDRFIVLNEEAQCVAPIRAKDVNYKGITSIRYRPRVLLPLSSLPALERHSDDFTIRTIALRMCSGCGPACFSLRSWCRSCTEKRRSIRQSNASTPFPQYCFHCKTVKDNTHVESCAQQNRGALHRCNACSGTHRTPICPGIMRPLSETTFGRRVFNLAPRSGPKVVAPPRRSPPTRAPTVDRQHNGGLVALNQQRSYAAAASNHRPSSPIAPATVSPDLVAFMAMMQTQMAAMNQAIQQQALLINKLMPRGRQQSDNNGDDYYDDDLMEEGDIDQFNEETQSFLNDAAPTALEQRAHAVQSSQH